MHVACLSLRGKEEMLTTFRWVNQKETCHFVKKCKPEDNIKTDLKDVELKYVDWILVTRVRDKW